MFVNRPEEPNYGLQRNDDGEVFSSYLNNKPVVICDFAKWRLVNKNENNRFVNYTIIQLPKIQHFNRVSF